MTTTYQLHCVLVGAAGNVSADGLDSSGHRLVVASCEDLSTFLEQHDELVDGAPIIDVRTVPPGQFGRAAWRMPMVDVKRAPDDDEPLGPMSYVSLETYARLWAEQGATVTYWHGEVTR